MNQWSRWKTTDSFVGKYRKNVRADTPARSAMRSEWVASKPSRAKSSSAASIRDSRTRAVLTARGTGVVWTIGRCYRF